MSQLFGLVLILPLPTADETKSVTVLDSSLPRGMAVNDDGTLLFVEVEVPNPRIVMIGEYLRLHALERVKTLLGDTNMPELKFGEGNPSLLMSFDCWTSFRQMNFADFRRVSLGITVA